MKWGRIWGRKKRALYTFLWETTKGYQKKDSRQLFLGETGFNGWTRLLSLLVSLICGKTESNPMIRTEEEMQNRGLI